MKFWTLLFGIVFSCVFTTANADIVSLEQIQTLEAARSAATLSLVDWKIGDSQDFKVTLGMGLDGTMRKEAFKEEGNAIWLRQELKLPIANDTSEMLVDRDSGRILKFIRNGKEESIPDGQLDIISQKS